MAVKTKSIDRNRFKKVYPRFRRHPSPGFMSDGEVQLESFVVNFSNEDEKQFQLEGRYTEVPTLTITPLGDISNVNVFITSITLASVPANIGRPVNVKIESSAKFTGKVHVQVMQA